LNKGIQKLVQLAKLDEGIIACDEEINNENEKLSEFNKLKIELEKNITQCEKLINESKNSIIKNDIHLKDLGDKLEKISISSKKVSTDKAIKALNIEEEVAHESIKFANDEIDRLNDLISKEEENLNSLKSKLCEETENIGEIKDSVNVSVVKIQNSQKEKEKEKDIILNAIDKNVSSIYIKIKKWAKQSVVVPVRNRACYGCCIMVGDSFYNSLKTTDEILTCPNCSRIVYLDEQNTDGEDNDSK
jgi:predicted  nucleic acid-binding Zn-ribbon protein